MADEAGTALFEWASERFPHAVSMEGFVLMYSYPLPDPPPILPPATRSLQACILTPSSRLRPALPPLAPADGDAAVGRGTGEPGVAEAFATCEERFRWLIYDEAGRPRSADICRGLREGSSPSPWAERTARTSSTRPSPSSSGTTP